MRPDPIEGKENSDHVFIVLNMRAIFYENSIRDNYIPQILDEVYLKKIYEPYVIGKKQLIIADFGSNIGITIDYFQRYAKKLYAIEPSKQHLNCLEELVRFNKFDNVTICPYAISNVNGKTNLFHSPNPTSFMVVPNVLPQEFGNEEVETVTIDEFFKREKIEHLDILKLDVEGMEGKIIASKEFAKLAPKIDVILGEYHDWSGISKGLFMNTLRDLGYDFKWRTDTQAACFQATRL